jgi:hypothetical protein
MVNQNSGTEHEQAGFSLGIAALIGKAMNQRDILDALVNMKDNRAQLSKVAREEAYIELSDCDLDLLLKKRFNNLTIIDLIKIAKDCLKQNQPDDPPKWCC